MKQLTPEQAAILLPYFNKQGIVTTDAQATYDELDPMARRGVNAYLAQRKHYEGFSSIRVSREVLDAINALDGRNHDERLREVLGL